MRTRKLPAMRYHITDFLTHRISQKQRNMIFWTLLIFHFKAQSTTVIKCMCAVQRENCHTFVLLVESVQHTWGTHGLLGVQRYLQCDLIKLILMKELRSNCQPICYTNIYKTRLFYNSTEKTLVVNATELQVTKNLPRHQCFLEV